MRLILGLAIILITFSAKSQQEGIWLHPNEGQWDKEILYKIDLTMGEMYLTKDGFTYALNNFNEKKSHDHDSKSLKEDESINFQIIKSVFLGSNWKGEKNNSNPSSFYRNYFQGNDPSKWKSKLYSFSSVELKNYYNNIDLLIEGTSSNLKYSFKIAPQMNPAVIQYKIEGSDKYYISENGDLHIKNRFGEIIEQKPVAWNIINGEKKFVEVKFKLKNGIISFDFPENYNKNYTLIIDPLLTFSTFTGATMDNWGMTATPDLNGNLYAGGIVFTGPGSYPTTTGAFDISYNGGTSFNYTLNGSTYLTPGFDVAISKFNSNGTNLLFSTYLGGLGNEAPHSLVTDANGDLYVLGVTSSSNFPVLPTAFDNSFNGGPYIAENELGYNSGADLYVTHFNSTGTSIVGATFIGGTGTDGINVGVLNYNYGDPFRGEIIVDNAGFVYISSTTQSVDFPTVNAAQNSLQGTQDAILLKINTALTNISWSTYFGGSGNETGNSVQISTNGKVFIAGGSNSNTLPFNTGEDLSFNGGISDGYVTKFNAGTGIIEAGTFMGINEYDQAYFVQLDLNNDVYIYGQTESNWPITPGLYGTPNSGQFIRKYNSNLTSTIWTTMIGAGSGHVEISPTAFLVSNCFDIYITGWGGEINTNFSNQAHNSTTNGFQVTSDAFQPTTNGNNFYIALLGSNASSLKYATFMGGVNSSYNHVDGGTSRFDKNGNIYHAVCAACGAQLQGFTTTPGVYSPTNNSTNCNLAAFKFELNTIEPIVSAPQTYICIPQPVLFINNSQNGNAYFWDFGDGTTSTEESPSHLYATAGSYNVTLIASDTSGCSSADSVTFQVDIGDFAGGAVQPVAPVCKGTSYQLEAYGGTNYLWSPSTNLDDATSPTPIATIDETTLFTVIVSDSCGADTIQVLLQVYTTNTTIIEDTSLCIGNSIQLYSSGGISYQWAPSISLSNSMINNPIAFPVTTTNYIVTITSPENCIYYDSVLVSVYFNPPMPVMPDTIVYCLGESKLVVVEGATSYNWFPSTFINTVYGDSVVINNPNEGYYFCDFTNSCGTKRDSLYVKIPRPIVNAGNDTTICYGDSVKLWANGTNTYYWFPSNTLNNPFDDTTYAHPIKNTTYYVIGSDQYGCSDTAKVQINTFPEIILDISSEVQLNIGEVAQLIALSNVEGQFYWSPPNFLSCTTCSNPIANPDENYTYTVTFIDENNCKVSENVNLFYEGIIYVPNTFTPDGTTFNEEFKASGINIQEFEMNIYNRWGEIIFTTYSLNDSWNGKYRNEDCPIGTYTWKIQYTDIINNRKELVGHINIVK